MQQTYIQNAISEINHLCSLGKQQDAKKKILKLKKKYPNFYQLWALSGIIHAQLNLFKDAYKDFSKAVKLSPNNHENYTNLGNVCLQMGRHNDAKSYFERSLSLKFSENAASGLVSLFMVTKNYNGAIEYLRSLLETSLWPEQIFIKLGMAFDANKNEAEAEASFRSALKIELSKNIDNPQGLIKLCELYSKNKKFRTMLEFCENVLAEHPKNKIAQAFLGSAMQELQQEKEAEQYFINVLKKDVNNSAIYYLLGTGYIKTAQFEKAIKAFEKFVNLEPKSHLGRTMLAQCRLSLGDFRQGWIDYENRHDVPPPAWNSAKFISQKPIWSGQKCKRLLVWAEQGIGDEIMFASFIPDLKKCCEKLILICDDRLHSIFSRSFGTDVEFLSRSKFLTGSQNEFVAKPSYDFHCSLGSIGRFLRSDISDFIKAQAAYLVPCKNEIKKWSPMIRNDKKKIIGISWKSANTNIGHNKSTDLGDFLRVFNQEPFSLVNLQYGDVTSDVAIFEGQNINFQLLPDLDKTNDFEGLLAVISACDEIVTVSNVTAHLAGSIGKRCHVLLSEKTDWRWHADLEYAYWYKNCLLYRKTKYGSWRHMFSAVKNSLS